MTLNNKDTERIQRETKEVLEALAVRRHIDHVTFCWCQKRWDALKPHEATCARARALWSKLEKK